jgi:hypothetical protein
MIKKRFPGCPQMLWITLWESLRPACQSLDFAWPAPRCLFSQHRFDLCKINDLAQIRANPDGARRRPSGIAPQHDFWG